MDSMLSIVNSLRAPISSVSSHNDDHGIAELLDAVAKRSQSCSEEERKEIGDIARRLKYHKSASVKSPIGMSLFHLTPSPSSTSSSSSSSSSSSTHNTNNNSGHNSTTSASSNSGHGVVSSWWPSSSCSPDNSQHDKTESNKLTIKNNNSNHNNKNKNTNDNANKYGKDLLQVDLLRGFGPRKEDETTKKEVAPKVTTPKQQELTPTTTTTTTSKDVYPRGELLRGFGSSSSSSNNNNNNGGTGVVLVERRGETEEGTSKSIKSTNGMFEETRKL